MPLTAIVLTGLQDLQVLLTSIPVNPVILLKQYANEQNFNASAVCGLIVFCHCKSYFSRTLSL